MHLYISLYIIIYINIKEMSQSEDPDKPSDAVAGEPEKVKNETEDGAKPARKKREITPEYRQVLIQSIGSSRTPRQDVSRIKSS